MLQNMFILNAAMQGAYHWSEGTGWDDCWIIIIRLSQNQQLNEKRWRSPFYNSIIRYCFPRWETGNWKLENWANGKGLSNARIRTNSECSLQFGTVFSENYSSIRLSSEHSGILAQWLTSIITCTNASVSRMFRMTSAGERSFGVGAGGIQVAVVYSRQTLIDI